MFKAVPGLSVGASFGVDKKKSEVWDETETTISVNWSGGGEIKVRGLRGGAVIYYVS
jgi:hypothetical protein